ncbi:putative mitochondrial hypothetical protein [Leptomonas pyrrhocoris]|uniref:Uncharacterized protein n=1 Tax=Leptomonas pyrrhocoris TaxID=157538 RepID=A0A0N0DVY6_LEPPY|nr:putative mitochondrial hypothetical protein [Leptomonas pyrrhocoris]XP_015659501.1 putative mitochondrial hypothetical protein [Leptomonas pyrrhocoris]XP_015659502.1 putative mitochondrial hypothetical protein [Leptomonas pyrrhocoris]KPA81061.1 putative mitochondrial hypothetical protein [Leptomonas pyrrhocoris]KPA81062.1 putative mitochondrial hypothetical protein [Leptomonas pyrrhocoris]KPA81063.1 putative mitochondrial hypothetical protein [Leptomonas pyrrhocoris]|eukprot:XP_015659500.1 putative mitochondrial hypothetical protein [Leptomonas pyrrhocoris]
MSVSGKKSSRSSSAAAAYPVEEEAHHNEEYPVEEKVNHEEEGYPVEEVNHEEEEAPVAKGTVAEMIDAPAVNAPASQSSEELEKEYHRLKAEVKAARARRDARVEEVTHGEAMPSLEELRDERVRLTEQVRHHKDEQDSLALDIEGQEGAAEVYQTAARVQRLEHFATRAEEFAEKTLPAEIEKTVDEDRHQSNAELCAYIQELQNKRSAVLKKVVASQENQKKKSQRSQTSQKNAAEESPEEKKAIDHTNENKDEAVVLQNKIRKFRSMKTKLQSDIVKERADSKKMEERMSTRMRAAELANARDARQCKEMNDRNAAVTTNSQLLMDQLNVEHYGMDNAPTTKQLLQDRQEREATPPPTPANERPYGRHGSGASVGSKQSHTNSVNSRQHAGKPPMVALKRTESQTNRDNAIREEVSASRRRDSDAASYQSSRRQSLSKPPLVASKPTASQQSRDNAIREEREREREEASVSRHRQRSDSIASDGHVPSVAAKSTASQRSREGKQ